MCNGSRGQSPLQRGPHYQLLSADSAPCTHLSFITCGGNPRRWVALKMTARMIRAPAPSPPHTYGEDRQEAVGLLTS